MLILPNQHNIVQIFNTKLTSLQTCDDLDHVEDLFNFNLQAHNPHNLTCIESKIRKLLFMFCPPLQWAENF